MYDIATPEQVEAIIENVLKNDDIIDGVFFFDESETVPYFILGIAVAIICAGIFMIENTSKMNKLLNNIFSTLYNYHLIMKLQLRRNHFLLRIYLKYSTFAVIFDVLRDGAIILIITLFEE